MKLSDLDTCLARILDIPGFKDIDRSLNGVQVGSRKTEISRVACAVDASLESFTAAADWKADMLLVHHGLYWGGLPALTGICYQRIRFLMEHDLALYACHLPLDAHMKYGNNVGIAHMLGLKDCQPFGRYRGRFIGVKGTFAEAMDVDALTARYFPSALRSLAFGRKKVVSVGIISGGAPFEVEQAIDEQLDLYITGDAQHGIYHTCREASINVLFAGHYDTETYGVKSIAEYLHRDHGLETTFIDISTGL